MPAGRLLGGSNPAGTAQLQQKIHGQTEQTVESPRRQNDHLKQSCLLDVALFNFVTTKLRPLRYCRHTFTPINSDYVVVEPPRHRLRTDLDSNCTPAARLTALLKDLDNILQLPHIDPFFTRSLYLKSPSDHVRPTSEHRH